ncbi:hypothetical protein [Sulfolobus sp. E11-6]|uniref:hypothetical protein n=1 Tax=Sulfolobus sp. E11-6 TaxID=2663020 RepID=UPI00129532ED|nr:hypothetical protein [Sulfolobus sp. E11-6]QGA68970.1 hypothetical protein GFS33_09820 [Sulfolobus sp. E11-6]
MKNEINDELKKTKTELTNTINFVIETLKMQGLKRKTALSLGVLMQSSYSIFSSEIISDYL